MTKNKRGMALYPFLFAFYPVLNFYSKNLENSFTITSGFFENLVLPVLVSLCAVTVFYFVFKLLLKDATKAALISFLLIVMFFSYGHLYNILDGFTIGGKDYGRHRYLLPVYTFFYLALIVVALKVKWDRIPVARFLNVYTIVMLMFPVVRIVNFNATESIGFASFTSKIGTTDEQLVKPDVPRDIYYIILDEYAGSSTLKNFFGYDNRPFQEYLESRGFYFAEHSRSNYGYTIPSMASSLNMMQLDKIQSITHKPLTSSLLIQMMFDSKVARMLKQIGYSFIYVHPGWSSFPHNPLADKEYFFRKIQPMHQEYLEITLFKPFLEGFQLKDHVNNVLRTFTELGKLESTGKPRFIYAHIMCPHQPYVFGRNTDNISLAEWLKLHMNVNDQMIEEYYVDQVIFVNKMVEKLVDDILAQPGPDPIIILQSDHGTLRFRQDLEDSTLYKAVLTNICAGYLPGVNNRGLYDTITPVNIFRVIFNDYFGGSYDMVEDRSYYSLPLERHVFTDVTDIVKWKGEEENPADSLAVSDNF